jgi:hypothetical protein
MEPVIVWAIGIGSSVFGLGMISAIAARHQQKKVRTVRLWEMKKKAESTEGQNDFTGGMSMAAGGAGNLQVREGELASISGSSR